MAEQVNHKCAVAGLQRPSEEEGDRPWYHAFSTNSLLAKSEKKNCDKLLKGIECVKNGAKEFSTKENAVKQAAAELSALLEGSPPEAAYMRSQAEEYQNSNMGLFGNADMSGQQVTQQQADAITQGVAAFHSKAEAREQGFQEDGRKTRQNKLTSKLNATINQFKTSAYYADNRAKLDPALDKLKAAGKAASEVLNGPSLGAKKGSCTKNIKEILDDFKFKAEKDKAIEMVNNPLNKGAKQLADEFKATKEAVAAGSIKINVVYDLEYKEQCILLSQISALSDYSHALDNVKVARDDADENEQVLLRRRLPYLPKGTGNAPLIVEGESFGFINKLTQPSGMGSFYNMTNAQISALQPLIRFYRVENANKKGVKIRETEIFFDSNLKDSKTVLMDKTKRGFGVGIESFDVVFDGQDMFAQKRCIKANLTLFAHDFAELLKPRGGFRYIDLALKTGKNIKKQTKNYKSNDDLNFRLKAVFGYSLPAKNGPASSLQGVLKNTFVSVNLTPVTHTFDFDEFGRVRFNIEYLAYVEEHCAKNNYNIFTDPGTYSTILRRSLAFDSANRTLNCDESEELRKAVKDIKNQDQETIKGEKLAMHSFLMKEMFLQGYIHYLNFNFEDLESVIKLGPAHDLVSNKVRRGDQEMNATLSADIQEAFVSELNKAKADKDIKKEMAGALLVSGGDAKQLAFFYIGDLLNVILSGMDTFLVKTQELIKSGNYSGLSIAPDILETESIALQRAAEEFKKFRLVLGPLEIVDHKNEQVKYINFADVPISVKYFSEWLTSKLLKKDQALYPLTQFLKDLFNDLLKNYLNDDSCYPFSIKQKVRLFEGVVTSYPNGSRDEISAKILSSKSHNNRLNINRASMPILNIRGKSIYDKPNSGFAQEKNYFIFYAGRTQPMELLTGNKGSDEGRGIYHYLLGKDKGLVKNISLNKTDSPGLKEVRFEQEGYDGLHQLREMYDVEIDSFANVTAFPGNYIFVDPLGFAPNLTPMSRDVFDLTDLGVGGYYMVTRASHEFGPGFGNTKLNAVWVASQGGNDAIVESGRGANEMKSAKCASRQAKQGKMGGSGGVGDFEYSGGPATSPYAGLDENPENPEQSTTTTSEAGTAESEVRRQLGGIRN